MKQSIGILIDAKNRTLKIVRISGLEDMYREMEVDLVTIGTHIDDKNSIFVDDEGLLKNPEHFFFWEGAHQPFAGNGLILAADDEGETISTTITGKEAQEKITFLSYSDLKKFNGGR